ncbi:MAG: hypothetical protein L6V81_00520 [Clostridium sp.]|nr:MAG: hypothetical protein L6V81_00520 [Clostridium sp.]
MEIFFFINGLRILYYEEIDNILERYLFVDNTAKNKFITKRILNQQ